MDLETRIYIHIIEAILALGIFAGLLLILK